MRERETYHRNLLGTLMRDEKEKKRVFEVDLMTSIIEESVHFLTL